ncbi:DMT family transporter [Aciduricibacillus chroicocephali]|uniref:DMT family transporter n=1 Tax=Aciduricibacillus chroicocephali TaxID=3054939 RepID=A0ABY9KVV1_9BACI|nr:DMT family transporter [Bacillaceae bacterium 44XB]
MNKKTFFLALITVTIWASAFPAIRASLQGGYTSGHLILVRFLIASLVFVIGCFLPQVRLGLPRKQDLPRIFILGLVGITMYHCGITFGSQTVNSGTAALFVGSAPIFTTIISVVVLNEKMNTIKWSGLGIGFIGIAIVAFGSSGGFALSRGVLFVLMAVIATSVFFVFQKPLLGKYNAIELTAYFTWAGTLPMLVFAPGVINNLREATLQAHLSAVYVGVFAAALAYVIWAMALSIGDPGSVSTMMYLEPPLALIIAFVWLGEWPHTVSLIGGAIAIGSLLFVHFMEKRKTKYLQY